jgi:ribonuclease J
VVQIDPDRIPDLLDLPIGGRTVLAHANGEPLGPFEARWPLFTDWLTKLGVKLLRMGCLGHAYQDDLHEFVRRVAPRVLVPIHTTSPTRLHPAPPSRRLVVDYARAYDFEGRPVG